MKKLINRPADVVREMLEGLVALSPALALLDTENVVVRSDLPAAAERPVALISGGGAGHEPAHAGYVGPGMLTAAVTGEVFTSPSVDAVLTAIRASAGPAGALLIVKNYTGDRLNFGLAAELATVEGIPTDVVVVADDVALSSLVPRWDGAGAQDCGCRRSKRQEPEGCSRHRPVRGLPSRHHGCCTRRLHRAGGRQSRLCSG